MASSNVLEICVTSPEGHKCKTPQPSLKSESIIATAPLLPNATQTKTHDCIRLTDIKASRSRWDALLFSFSVPYHPCTFRRRKKKERSLVRVTDRRGWTRSHPGWFYPDRLQIIYYGIRVVGRPVLDVPLYAGRRIK